MVAGTNAEQCRPYRTRRETVDEKKTYEVVIAQGRELREMRRRHAERGSPCEICKRDRCPLLCFPRRDYLKRMEAGRLPALQKKGGGGDG